MSEPMPSGMQNPMPERWETFRYYHLEFLRLRRFLRTWRMGLGSSEPFWFEALEQSAPSKDTSMRSKVSASLDSYTDTILTIVES